MAARNPQSQKRRGRKAYLDDFQKGPNGQYEYQGALYTYVSKGKSLKQALAALWLLSAAQLICTIAAGFLPPAGQSGAFYVLLPYAVTLILGIAHIWALCKLTVHRSELREYIYNASVKRMQTLEICTMISSAITLAGEGIHLALYGFSGHLFASVVFLLLIASIFAISLCVRRSVLRMVWSK